MFGLSGSGRRRAASGFSIAYSVVWPPYEAAVRLTDRLSSPNSSMRRWCSSGTF